MMAIIAQYVDKRVRLKLLKESYEVNIDYVVCRYVDDIFIFADEELLVEKIIKLYRDEGELFRFRLNDQKCIMGKLPYNWFAWKEKIHAVNDYVCKTLFWDTKDSKYLIKFSPQMLPNMKMFFQDIISEQQEYQAKITSYVLTTIYKKIKVGTKPLFSGDRLYNKVCYLLDAVFSFYSFSLSYNNTDKLISILYELTKQVPDEIFKDCIFEVIRDYSISIIKANPEDIINLILLVSMYNIGLPDKVEMSLAEKIQSGNNPLMFAVLLLYYRYDKKKSVKFKTIVEEKINWAISNIYDKASFFQYSELWWLYIFSDCPLISQAYRDKIREVFKDALKFVKNGKNNNANEAKKLVLNFFIDTTISNKLINWEMKKEDLFTQTIFTTYERTLFNGYSGKINEDMDFTY